MHMAAACRRVSLPASGKEYHPIGTGKADADPAGQYRVMEPHGAATADVEPMLQPKPAEHGPVQWAADAPGVAPYRPANRHKKEHI